MARKNSSNIIIRIQNWIESVPGQTFLNYAYSWGAAVVILGALFKLTHIAGANAMLFIGMGTEVLVFFISGFDRPAELKKSGPPMAADDEEWNEKEDEETETQGVQSAPVQGGAYIQGGQPVVLGGQSVVSGGQPVVAGGEQPVASGGQPVYVGGPIVVGGSAGAPVQGGAVSGGQPVQGGAQTVAAASADGSAQQPFDVKALAEMVNTANAEIFAKVLEDARDAASPEMKEAAEAYVEELKVLTETLSRVAEQAELMTRDSHEMDNLNRTLTGINTIYEMQLRSISTQVSTIDQINEQTRKMARQIEDLNGIYSRMIQALTVNMKHAPGNPLAE